MPTHYDTELTKLAATYESALRENITAIKAAIAGASESSVIAVGSGGSFTAATLFCNLHEAYTGRVSRASTPLEIICNPTLASASPVFMISAEGKNPDILEALDRARLHSARQVHVITNRPNSALVESAARFSDITTHVFELAEKDGYLATNSLLLDAVLIARAYEELDRATEKFPSSVDALRLGNEAIDDWLSGAEQFIAETAKRGSVIVTFSPLLRAVAADLESKLAESALVHCQLTDLRSFAHGRHLWLAQRPADCTILALIEPTLQGLWDKMAQLLPASIPVHAMRFGGASPRDLLAGLIAQMRLVSGIARHMDRDPGRPDVPQFGRDLHYLDLQQLIPAPTPSKDRGEQSKFEVLGARWPSIERAGFMKRSLEAFRSALEQQTFRAIVFDYDGTLCASHRNDNPPPKAIADQFVRLIEAGVVIGIASGRGGSIQDRLRQCLPEALWPKVRLGLYNAGCICTLDGELRSGQRTSEFLSHVTRIVGRLKALGVPIETTRTTHPYQVSVRFREGAQAESNWFVVADALRQAGLDPSRVFRSKHSIDVLELSVDKSHLIGDLVQKLKIDPYQVLSVGDQGAWPGNDASLLEHRFALSVDIPSRRLDRGWKLAPAHKRGVDATIWYLERVELLPLGRFQLKLTSPDERGETS